jgi:hypothetical protein
VPLKKKKKNKNNKKGKSLLSSFSPFLNPLSKIFLSPFEERCFEQVKALWIFRLRGGFRGWDGG